MTKNLVNKKEHAKIRYCVHNEVLGIQRNSSNFHISQKKLKKENIKIHMYRHLLHLALHVCKTYKG